LLKKKSDLSPLPEVDPDAIATMVASIEKRAAQLETAEAEIRAWEKEQAKAAGAELQRRAAAIASDLVDKHQSESAIVAEVADADGAFLQGIADAMKTMFNGPIFLAGKSDSRVDLVAMVPSGLTKKFQAGSLMQKIAPLVGGKGGGRPENARGAGSETAKIPEALARARALFESGNR
jgi:alanyl-tRNA synthetase